MQHPDTIAAIATAPGEGGVAIVRISGAGAYAIADAVFRGRGKPPSARPPFTMAYGSVVDAGGHRIDDVLLLLMRAPRSYTGEDQVEIQCHGGPVSSARILRRVLEAGARLAEPGEFTRRAFLHGRLDLVQAEAVADLIHARSERAAQAAVEQLTGSLSLSLSTIYDGTMAAHADLEATLDFAEEELPEAVIDDLLARLHEVRGRVERLLATWSDGRLLREGALVVIAGRPNVGKSTLMNLLLGRERAIVTDIPGTTRDTLEEGYLLHGIPLRLVDTAGLRDTDCVVEQEGIRRSRALLDRADIILYLIDAPTGPTDGDRHVLDGCPSEKTAVIVTKTDLAYNTKIILEPINCIVHTSLFNPHSADLVREVMAERLHDGFCQGAEQQAVIAERHRTILVDFLREVDAALALMRERREDQAALAGAHLRDGLERLGQATGRVYHQELLNTIFSRFCVGK
jgi:tRNA modification GTPase